MPSIHGEREYFPSKDGAQRASERGTELDLWHILSGGGGVIGFRLSGLGFRSSGFAGLA